MTVRALFFAALFLLFAGPAAGQPTWLPGDSTWTGANQGMEVYTAAEGDSAFVYPKPNTEAHWGRAKVGGEWFVHCPYQEQGERTPLSELQNSADGVKDVLNWVVKDGTPAFFHPEVVKEAECLRTWILHLEDLQQR